MWIKKIAALCENQTEDTKTLFGKTHSVVLLEQLMTEGFVKCDM